MANLWSAIKVGHNHLSSTIVLLHVSFFYEANPMDEWLVEECG